MRLIIASLILFALTTPVFAMDQDSLTEVVARYDATSESNPVWDAFIDKMARQPRKNQILYVNRFMNAVPYQTDQHNYHVADYWATPIEFLKNGGDCEDYAIAKYITLKRLGIPPEDMKIIIVHDATSNEDHAILEIDGNILDNQSKSSQANYTKIVAINEVKTWVY
jgi:predicted transglutaminase-like cysteine proteinase